MKYTLKKDKSQSSVIRGKRLRIFAITCILCFITTGLLFFVVAKDMLYDSVKDSGKQGFIQTKDAIEQQISDYYYASYTVQNSRIILEAMQDGEYGDIIQKYEAKRKIEAQLKQLTEAMSLYPITIYLEGDNLFLDNISFLPVSELEKYEEFTELRKSNQSYIWLEPEVIRQSNLGDTVKVFSFIRKVGNNEQPIAYQKLSIRANEIEDLITLGSSEGQIYLYSSEDESLLLKKGENGVRFIQEERMPAGVMELAGRDEWGRVVTNRGSFLVYADRIIGTDWIMLMTIPNQYFWNLFTRVIVLWLGMFVILTYIYQKTNKRYSDHIIERVHVLEKI